MVVQLVTKTASATVQRFARLLRIRKKAFALAGSGSCCLFVCVFSGQLYVDKPSLLVSTFFFRG